MDFNNKLVWITGASSGIGEALALALSHKGARLVLSARRAEQLEQVRKRCRQPELHFIVPLDMTDGASLDTALAALKRIGTVDVLINNAGISQRALARDTGMAVLRNLMEVNFFAQVTLTQGVLPDMISQRRGVIVNLASVAGKIGSPRRSGYCASKHALVGYMDALRAELKDTGVAVCNICPGFVQTNISVNALTADGGRHNTMESYIANGIPVAQFAERMIAAIEAERAETVITGLGKDGIGYWAHRISPNFYHWMIQRVAAP